jgi:hypothetical protein
MKEEPNYLPLKKLKKANKVQKFSYLLAAVEPEELVQYSHKISVTTSGPPLWSPGKPLVMYKPPAPQEDEMRSGLLYTKK